MEIVEIEDIINIKRIKGFKKYWITESGMVWSDISEQFLKRQVNKYGYYKVGLYKNNKQCTRKIHRLVALTYISNPMNKLQVNHIDGDKLNNNVNNLEWVTPGENNQHALDTGLRCPKKVEQYLQTGEYIQTWFSASDAESKLNISHIRCVCKGDRKTAGGFKWRLVE